MINLQQKESELFPFSPRINSESSRIMDRSTSRIPLTERGKCSQPKKVQAMSNFTGNLTFYDDYDDKGNTLKEDSNSKFILSPKKGILKSSKHRKVSKRDKIKSSMKRLYKTPGKENQPEYILVSKRRKGNDQTAVVIKEYQQKSARMSKIHRKLRRSQLKTPPKKKASLRANSKSANKSNFKKTQCKSPKKNPYYLSTVDRVFSRSKSRSTRRKRKKSPLQMPKFKKSMKKVNNWRNRNQIVYEIEFDEEIEETLKHIY